MEGWPRRRRTAHRGRPDRIGVPGDPRLDTTPGRDPSDLHICPRCGSHLVQPVEWAPVERSRCRVELECPECAWLDRGVYDQHVLDRFDEILDDGAATLAADLERLERANMEAEINTFLKALAHDRILPEDF